MRNNLKVMIWGKEVGRLSWDNRRKRAVFEYSKTFLSGDLDIAPLTASIRNSRNRLPFYGQPDDNIFHGLPAFISDSLPGRWGNTVFSAWAQANNIYERDLTAVDKLSFIGRRAMGALEFEPSQPIGSSGDLALDSLYRKAQEIQENREGRVIDSEDLSLESLYEVGTSAGGQHTKAIIARNNETSEIRSGQIPLPDGYTYYLLKFAEHDFPFLPVIEYVYSQMAAKAGIRMMPCELIEIDGDRHFLTERFDRKDGSKIHTQSLAAMNPEASSYEDLMLVCEELHLPYKEKEETFRRIVFNILTTNVDAHIKNFSFMLEEGGSWHITPAYDLTFSCLTPTGRFDTSHALRLGGKTIGIDRDDLLTFARRFSIKTPAAIIRQVAEAVLTFRELAEQSAVEPYWIDQIERHFAEQTPDLLAALSGYKPTVCSFEIDGNSVTESTCQEMPNGAMRLTATINSHPRRITFAPTSPVTRQIHSDGGPKMPVQSLRHYIQQFFLNG